MKIEVEEIIEKLVDDYRWKARKITHFEANDDEVDADWEKAQNEYIAYLYKFITGEEFKDEPLFIMFDPQANPDKMPLNIGDKVVLRERVNYMEVIDLDGWDENDQEIIKRITTDINGDLYLKSGLIMIYEGLVNGWPIFNCEGVSLDFAGPAFMVEKIKDN